MQGKDSFDSPKMENDSDHISAGTVSFYKEF